MKHLVMVSLSGLLALTFLLLASLVVWAEEITCEDFIGVVTVDNLRVPPDANCTLAGTRVMGTIKVETGASLTAQQITVNGNIQAEGAAAVNVLAGSIIGGSIQIKQSAAEIEEVTVNGDIQFESNIGAVSATRNQVGGNVQAFKNQGGVTFADNIIGGNLQCKENEPPPTGGNNIVQGNKEDQCAFPNAVGSFFILLPLIGHSDTSSEPDSVPPDTTINSGPDTTTTNTDATFVFSASEPGSTFECSLDGLPFAGCVSPQQFVGLSGGSHTFAVRAIDQVGNADPTPASYTWTISPTADCGAPITVFADADSWIDQNSSSNNFGTDAILKVRSQGPSDNFRALVHFALPASIPQGCVIQSATLRLYAASWTDGRTLQALRVADGWAENSVTWNNQPQTSGPVATTSSGGDYREWSVAALVQEMYNTASNHGFLIRDATEGEGGPEQQFHSREKGENPPTLVISFTPAGG
jgi:hypothetical protein